LTTATAGWRRRSYRTSSRSYPLLTWPIYTPHPPLPYPGVIAPQNFPWINPGTHFHIIHRKHSIYCMYVTRSLYGLNCLLDWLLLQW